MLTQLSVKNLAIVTELELHFSNGMHVITGETGAGKSILIDALSIALGERASAEQIRAGETQAEVTVCFDITKIPAIHQLIDNSEECIIRRIINSDGRSRAYLNGVSVTMQQLKELAPHLIQIHSQHQHHALLHSDFQRELLDVYAGHIDLLSTVQSLYQKWSEIKRNIEKLTAMQQQADKLTLLNYQLQELDNLNLQPNELVTLDQQHKQLCKSEDILQACQEVTDWLIGDTALTDQLHSNLNKLTDLQKVAPQLTPTIELLQQATINIQEAAAEIDAYFTTLDLDPSQLQSIEQRLSTIHTLARKLRIDPQQLHLHQQALTAERDQLAIAAENLEQLQQELLTTQTAYNHAALRLTASREKAAVKLTKEVITRLQQLEMPHVKFNIDCDPNKQNAPTMYGIDTINFMVTTNPGQPLSMLKKIASGGELSRISLAIQVITAEKMAIPTLILDEVDVGISGKTAATVGQLMRELGTKAQIICITHLPQVASQGHIHFKVEKHQSKQSTSTVIIPLKHTQRVEELARLLGGISITPEALANAERLLETV